MMARLRKALKGWWLLVKEQRVFERQARLLRCHYRLRREILGLKDPWKQE